MFGGKVSEGYQIRLYMEACDMDEIDKANIAMDLVFNLLRHEEKILAVSLVRKIYSCNLKDAVTFVNFVEYLYNLGN